MTSYAPGADVFGGSIAIDTKAVREDGEFEGFASTYNNRDLGGDIVMPGAFAKSLESGRKVKLLWQHDPSRPIGTVLSFAEQASGLKMKGKLLLSTTAGREAYENIKAEAVDGLSIGYRVLKDEYDTAKQARLIKAADLIEVSVVTFPMNPKALITAVKAEDFDPRELERSLREAGISRADAVTAVGVLKKALRRDAGGNEPRPRDAAYDALTRELARIAQSVRA